MLEIVRRNKVATLAVATFAALALAHLPANSFITLFDKNSAIQFIVALFLGIPISITLFIKRRSLNAPAELIATVFLLLLSVLISLLTSKSPTQGLTGDTFRYNGFAALLFLIAVGGVHGLLDFDRFISVIKMYLGVLTVVNILGVLQKFKVIELPGIQGTVTSTFGNLDFLAALIGTSLPLWAIGFFHSKRRGKALSIAGALLSIVILKFADAKQGYVDIALAVVLIGGYFLYSKVKYRYFDEPVSIRVKTVVFSVALLLWLEFVLTIPFSTVHIPHVSNDPQVAIRGVLWLAAVNQFKSSPFFGVGPDQYGDYYEHFRSFTSLTILPGDSANDAHSTPMQLLATVGIVGTLLYCALVVLVIRSVLVLHRHRPEMQRTVAMLAIFFFIYITNAAVSPTILANKYLAWAIGGFIIFLAHRELGGEAHPAVAKLAKKVVAPLSIAMAAVLAFTAIGFSAATVQYYNYGQFNMKTNGKLQKVSVNPFLPCQYYFPDLLKLVGVQSPTNMGRLSEERLKTSPRCYQAALHAAGLASEKNDLKEMRKYVYQLIDLAPARREVLDAATVYSIRAHDKKLDAIVTKLFAKMGITLLDVPK